ncbi:hypothetical protein PLESTB_000175300 [Pleodorina starrii]|uniref:Uncharacterized protein n=1 Tax=Pleodorina starrii TaxID=330485 RepID=A0A9W6EY26_9CHLO|nr:hypothetical protein PLESTB_000175300 [Pleodorina starrii]
MSCVAVAALTAAEQHTAPDGGGHNGGGAAAAAATAGSPPNGGRRAAAVAAVEEVEELLPLLLLLLPVPQLPQSLRPRLPAVVAASVPPRDTSRVLAPALTFAQQPDTSTPAISTVNEGAVPGGPSAAAQRNSRCCSTNDGPGDVGSGFGSGGADATGSDGSAAGGGGGDGDGGAGGAAAAATWSNVELRGALSRLLPQTEPWTLTHAVAEDAAPTAVDAEAALGHLNFRQEFLEAILALTSNSERNSLASPSAAATAATEISAAAVMGGTPGPRPAGQHDDGRARRTAAGDGDGAGADTAATAAAAAPGGGLRRDGAAARALRSTALAAMPMDYVIGMAEMYGLSYKDMTTSSSTTMDWDSLMERVTKQPPPSGSGAGGSATAADGGGSITAGGGREAAAPEPTSSAVPNSPGASGEAVRAGSTPSVAAAAPPPSLLLPSPPPSPPSALVQSAPLPLPQPLPQAAAAAGLPTAVPGNQFGTEPYAAATAAAAAPPASAAAAATDPPTWKPTTVPGAGAPTGRPTQPVPLPPPPSLEALPALGSYLETPRGWSPGQSGPGAGTAGSQAVALGGGGSGGAAAAAQPSAVVLRLASRAAAPYLPGGMQGSETNAAGSSSSSNSSGKSVERGVNSDCRHLGGCPAEGIVLPAHHLDEFLYDADYVVPDEQLLDNVLFDPLYRAGMAPLECGGPGPGPLPGLCLAPHAPLLTQLLQPLYDDDYANDFGTAVQGTPEAVYGPAGQLDALRAAVILGGHYSPDPWVATPPRSAMGMAAAAPGKRTGAASGLGSGADGGKTSAAATGRGGGGGGGGGLVLLKTGGGDDEGDGGNGKGNGNDNDKEKGNGNGNSNSNGGSGNGNGNGGNGNGGSLNSRIIFSTIPNLIGVPYPISIYAGELYLAEADPALAAEGRAARGGLLVDYYVQRNYYTPYFFFRAGPSAVSTWAATARSRGQIGVAAKARALGQALFNYRRSRYDDNRAEVFLSTRGLAASSVGAYLYNNPIVDNKFLLQGPNVGP